MSDEIQPNHIDMANIKMFIRHATASFERLIEGRYYPGEFEENMSLIEKAAGKRYYSNSPLNMSELDKAANKGYEMVLRVCNKLRLVHMYLDEINTIVDTLKEGK